MKIFTGLLVGFWLSLTLAAAQEETNVLSTQLEQFEARTNALIVRGFGQVGSATISSGTVAVRCREVIDLSHSQKMYGVVFDFSGEGRSRQTAVVDDDELDDFIAMLDYLMKITPEVTAMPAFEAHYATRSGLRFLALGSRHQPGMQFFLRYDDAPRISISSDQLQQIRNLSSQARAQINNLKGVR
jgi:hypothetical protein